MIIANTFAGFSDSEIIEAALRNLDAERTLVISAKEDGSPWLLDRAILLPGDVTVILRNCILKLSNRCRDNFFRSTNCGLTVSYSRKCELFRSLSFLKSVGKKEGNHDHCQHLCGVLRQ